MKALVLLIALSLVPAPAFAQTITANEASAHVGQTVTVKGVVAEVHTSKKGHTYLDIDARYPNQIFTGFIFSENAGLFPNAASLEGKTVEINGPVTLYDHKPEIILRSASQLKVE